LCLADLSDREGGREAYCLQRNLLTMNNPSVSLAVKDQGDI
jgi:hypothetical protein